MQDVFILIGNTEHNIFYNRGDVIVCTQKAVT